MRPTCFRLRLLVSLAVAAALLAAPGCGTLPTIAYWVYGNKVKAKFNGLEKKRVAVVCLDANSLKGPGSEADNIAKAVSRSLGFNVTDIQLVRHSEVADWFDNHDQDVADYADIGRGVKADMVVGIDLESFSIHEGQTLLKGRASVATRVYDMQRGGEVVYESALREITWPESGARHVTESEANFRVAFIQTLAMKISHEFYDYEAEEDYGLDAAFLGNN
ncbi:MAG: hypothetical protein L0211_26445 [Planctomycetaceae bacterium]|nr:hypothetical protein [Planctomycetaceae bacterium]